MASVQRGELIALATQIANKACDVTQGKPILNRVLFDLEPALSESEGWDEA